MSGTSRPDGGAQPSASTTLHAPEIPDADPSLDNVYAAVPRRSVDEGYDSDGDTMPSLVTVEDSSDGEVY